MEEDFYRYDPRAVRVPLLECVNGLPLRTPLAGLIGFVTAFCKEAKTSRRVPRPLRRSFELALALNRPKSRPLARRPAPRCAAAALSQIQGQVGQVGVTLDG